MLARHDAAADAVIPDRVRRGRRILLHVIGQQAGDRGQVGLGHRAKRQVGRGEAQIEQRPVAVGHSATL